MYKYASHPAALSAAATRAFLGRATYATSLVLWYVAEYLVAMKLERTAVVCMAVAASLRVTKSLVCSRGHDHARGVAAARSLWRALF